MFIHLNPIQVYKKKFEMKNIDLAFFPVYCSMLQLDHGNVKYSRPDRKNGTLAEFICNQGYAAEGHLETFCLADGNWQFPPPHCVGN